MAFGPDKVVFVIKRRANVQAVEPDTELHYTFHAGPDSGVIDLHETKISADGQKHYRTLFALQQSDIPPLLQQLTPMVTDLLGLLRPLRLGWMRHRGISVARGVEPITDQDIAAVTKKRKHRLLIDPQLYRENVYVPEFLEEIYEFPDGSFSLFRRQRKIGLGFKPTDPEGHVRLVWIKSHDLARFANHWQPKVLEALRSAAIPPERYSEYSFLRP